MLAGGVAWGLAGVLDRLIQALPPNLALNPTVPEQVLWSMVLWQVLVIAPAAEAVKFAAVVLPLGWLIRRYHRVPAQPSTVLLATIAVALGFVAQTNLVALWYDRAPVINLLINVPLQAIVSMPWGFALGFTLCRLGRYREYSIKWLLQSWLAAVLCHGAWNGLNWLSQLPGQWVLLPEWPPMTLADLRYVLFPWALWLWWQTERMLWRSQGEPAPQLITATPRWRRWQQLGWVWVCLLLGGTALNTLRDFGDSLQDTWEMRLTFDQPTAIALLQALLRTVMLSMLAIYILARLRRANAEQ
jgi:PrsW family intramembrane metalloprotease